MSTDKSVGAPSGIQILIGDAHEVVRRGLKEWLLECFPGTIITEARDGDEIRHRLADGRHDLLLLDIDMPRHSGFTVLREAMDTRPKLPIIVVSEYPEDQYAKPCIDAGAAAYVSKGRISEDLAQAVRIACGQTISRGGLCAMSE